MIIGFTGKMHSGKDTCGDYFVSRYNFKKYSFAEPVKQIAKIVFGFSYTQLYGDEKDIIDSKWNITPRECLQKIGTDMFRKHFWDDIWIRSLEEKIDNNDCVICDVRFQNEADMIKRRGGIIIKIIRNYENTGHENTCHENTKHESENNEVGYDYLIENNSDMADLHEQLENIYKTYNEEHNCNDL